MASFTDMTPAQTEAIQSWVTGQLNTQMEMIGRAASYVDGIDQKANALTAQTEREMERMAERVTEINRLQSVVQDIAGKTEEKFNQVIQDFKSFCEAARAEISTSATANKEAMTKAEEVHTSVNDLFQKCSIGYDQNKAELEVLRQTFTAEATSLRQGVQAWSATYAQEIKAMVQNGMSGAGFEQKPGTGSAKHDKKELSVWKIPENVSKPDFRHWLDAVDIQLEAIHGFQFPDLVLGKIKRSTTVITKEILEVIIGEINDEHHEKVKKEAIEKTGAPPGIQSTSADPWHHANRSFGADLIDVGSWDFDDKSRWLYTYLIAKLNTELHAKTSSVEGKNGLEVYRQMCNIVDAVPENYKFFLDSQFTAMPQVYGDKIKGLKDLYNFRLMLKAKVMAYKKAIGCDPDFEQLKQVLYVCMDMQSKNLASQSSLDRRGYGRVHRQALPSAI